MITWEDMTKEPKQREGDEAPQLKDILIVVIVVAALIAAAWIAWFKFGWFH